MAKEEVKDGTGINAAKLKALQATIDKIEKDYGKGTIMKLGDQPKWEVSVIPSGSIALDAALGIGGYPRGRVIEIYGPESSGKTTLAIHAIAQAQKQGGIAAIIDAEHAFDRTYARNLGIRISVSRTFLLGCVGLLTAVVTAFCGPISFIGLAVPHAMRWIYRTSCHKRLIPSCFIGGAIVALACNLLAHSVGDLGVLPINTLTPLLGVPVVLLLLWKGTSNGE
mgnify:CR=1 FL=1